jgi:polyphosphate kinase
MNKKILIAREISWLSFNARILQEANDSTLPLKEQIRFLGIYSNNSDEFFRVRVSMLKKLIKFNDKKNKSYLGKNPQKILDQIHRIILRQQVDFNRIWKKIIEELKKEKVFLVDDKQLNAKQKVFVRNFFDQDVSSSIIPLFIENMPYLPPFGDYNIFLGVAMQKHKGSLNQRFAIIEIPTKNMGRFVSLPSAAGEQNFMLLEDLIRFNLPRIFSHLGYTHFEAHMFKVTKDAEFDIDNDIATTFIQKIEKGVKNRSKARAIRFLYDKGMNTELLELLISKLNLSHRDSIIPGGHIRNFRDFIDFPAILPNYEFRPRPFLHPTLAKSLRVSDVIMQQDVLLHLPYHSFNSIIDLLREAAMDPDVKSIKITAYRLASNSKICNALINAVRNGKQVSVVLELRARFDEAANLEWRTKLEEEGVKVFVGIPNMKVHAKLCVIKKQIGNRIEQYGFIGTGNLNEKTALIYIDDFLLTSDPDIMADINRIFKALESPESNWRQQLDLCKTLIISPCNMRDALSTMINREIKAAKNGKPAKIILIMNSLSDEKLIKKIYKAAAAGVEIKLIVRGIFCAAIDQKEFVQPVTAISIVDEYLEHSRIWFFHNAGDEEIYISSADWMIRNLDYRIEVAVPIKDKAIKEELKHILKIKLSDNVKARWLDKELSNQYVSSAGKKIRSQIAIYHYLKRKRS